MCTVALPDGSEIRGWHLLPAGELATRSAQLSDIAEREMFFEASLLQADCVVLSLHGNAGNRGTRDRVAEDRMLASQAHSGNCHVIAIDYRGFGDSSGWPTHWPSEESTAEDSMALWSWLEHRLISSVEGNPDKQPQDAVDTDKTCNHGCESKLPNVFIYGHSLGCAISTQLAGRLSSRTSTGSRHSLPLAGLILVSPFTSVADVARDYPYTAFLRLVPYAVDIM